MASLGKFGTSKPQVDDTFEWFDTEIRVHPDLTDLAFVELFAAMADSDDGGAAVDALRGMASTLVHPDDLDQFWQLARANRQSMEDLAQLAASLIGALTERPTKRPSASSDGPPLTVASSTADSALAELDGRPDLQVAVLRAATA